MGLRKLYHRLFNLDFLEVPMPMTVNNAALPAKIDVPATKDYAPAVRTIKQISMDFLTNLCSLSAKDNLATYASVQIPTRNANGSYTSSAHVQILDFHYRLGFVVSVLEKYIQDYQAIDLSIMLWTDKGMWNCSLDWRTLPTDPKKEVVCHEHGMQSVAIMECLNKFYDLYLYEVDSKD